MVIDRELISLKATETCHFVQPSVEIWNVEVSSNQNIVLSYDYNFWDQSQNHSL